MGKEANIKRKSTKTPVIIYRVCLKIAFASLMLLCGLTIEKGFAAKDTLYALSLSFTAIFALLYQIVYYYYKTGSEDIKYKKQDPIQNQILFMTRTIAFFIGVAVVILGAYTINRFVNAGYRFLGTVTIIAGSVFCQLIYNNKSLFSHISTFFTNASVGMVIYSIYFAYERGFSPAFFAFPAAALLCVAIAETAFYYYNAAKHKYDDIDRKTQLKIRVMYLLRNTLSIIIVYCVIAMLIITGRLQVIENSNIFEYISKILPMLISIITVSVLLYNNFKKPGKAVQSYTPVKDEQSFLASITAKYPATGLFIKSVNYVMENMNAKKGYTRYSGEDYYYHPFNVAKILLDKGVSEEETLASAILHDCIEDLADCDKAKIAELTNQGIAKTVELLSKKKDLDYKDEGIMREYLDNIMKNGKAVAVKIADRMHNMSTLSNISEEKRLEKWSETRKYYLPLLEKAVSKYPEYADLFNAAKSFFQDGE